MYIQFKRAVAVGVVFVAVVGCGSSDDESGSSGTESASEPSPTATEPAATEPTEPAPTEPAATEPTEPAPTEPAASTDGFARARAEVEKYASNPPLTVSELPSRPDTSTYAIQINCTHPSCAPGAMKPAMDVLGWKFEEMTYDEAGGPAAVQQVLTQAIAAEPDVILFGLIYPESIFQEQVDEAVERGIKVINIGGNGGPGYSACIQCAGSLAELGRLAANIALADAGEETVIAVAFDKTIGPLVAEADALKEEAAANGDGTEVLDLEQSVIATPADNAARTISFLQRNPDVEYVVYTNPSFIPAAALESAGLAERVKIIGIYPLSAADVALVEDGKVLAFAVGELQALYWRAADAAARATMGLEIDPIDPIQTLRVMNQSNADISLLDPLDFGNIFKTAWHIS